MQQIKAIRLLVDDDGGPAAGGALLDLIRGKVDLWIVLNRYQATDFSYASVWIRGSGWVDEATGKKRMAKATRVQHMDKVRSQQMKGHDLSLGRRAAVKSPDGGCSSPWVRGGWFLSGSG